MHTMNYERHLPFRKNRVMQDGPPGTEAYYTKVLGELIKRLGICQDTQSRYLQTLIFFRKVEPSSSMTCK